MNTSSSSTLENCIREAFFEPGEPYPDICTLHKLSRTGTNSSGHNCLACNFSEIVTSIGLVARVLDKIDDIFTKNATYIFWLYLLCERMEEIIKLISLPVEIGNEDFPQLKKINKWANFLKHPKAFFLVHHPQYDPLDTTGMIVIDEKYIVEFWGGDKKNAKLYAELSNAQLVGVVFPDLCQMTQNLGAELKKLRLLIEQNPAYQRVLQNKTVLENYFTYSFSQVDTGLTNQ
jgi:hypothetical protein